MRCQRAAPRSGALTRLSACAPAAAQAQFNADQLLTQREQVSSQARQAPLCVASAQPKPSTGCAALTPPRCTPRQVRAGLLKRAADFGITLEDVALTHLSFSAEYARAIEFKQVSQQEAERSKYVVLKAEQERRAAVIRAEGESESARLISQATKATGPALIEMRRIEAAKEIAATLSRGRNVMYVPGGQQLLMGMPAPGASQ
jgi:regulator of protease activity HflC (stomatin/prohibitin superfamily)